MEDVQKFADTPATKSNSTCTPLECRLGFWSALSVTVIDVVYVLTGLVWLIAAGWRTREPLEPAEPYLAILELLILVSAPLLVIVMAAVHAYADRNHKTLALIALTFMAIFALLTAGVHFIQLSVVRQLQSQGVPVPPVLQFYPWPSTFLALDLLAWDLFLGLSLLFAAPVFSGCRLNVAIRCALLLGGALCVAGVFGPGLGLMRLQFLAIVGYAFVLPVICGLLAVRFRRELHAAAKPESVEHHIRVAR
jgi:hypothetical protein